MDAISLLKQDHRDVKALFREFQGLGDRAESSRQKLFEAIDEALTLHTKIEERLLYPAVKERARANSDERLSVLESYEEHAVVKTLLKEIEKIDPSDETYRAKVKVVIDCVEHHVEEEEEKGGLFDIARELLGQEALEAMAEQIEAMKEKAGV
jgi:hemerythrin superfamily protein